MTWRTCSGRASAPQRPDREAAARSLKQNRPVHADEPVRDWIRGSAEEAPQARFRRSTSPRLPASNIVSTVGSGTCVQ
jgi:hypothetical protein